MDLEDLLEESFCAANVQSQRLFMFLMSFQHTFLEAKLGQLIFERKHVGLVASGLTGFYPTPKY